MSTSPYYVTLKSFIDEIGLESCYMPGDPEEIHITVPDIDRPGLELVGYLKYYDNRYVMVFGMTEMSFLDSESEKEQRSHLEPLFSQKPPAVIIARSLQPFPVML